MPPSKNFTAPNSRAHRRPEDRRTPSPTARAALVVLPPGGCDLPAPDLPSGRDWSEAERARWAELWSSPQASQWDESAVGTVAALVIYEQAVMSSQAPAWMGTELRHAADALGLTPKSMAALGWKIEDTT